MKSLILMIAPIFAAIPDQAEKLPKAKFTGTPIESGQYPFIVLVTAFYQPSEYSDYYQDPELPSDENYNDIYKEKDSGYSEYKGDQSYYASDQAYNAYQDSRPTDDGNMVTTDCVGVLLNYKYVLTTASCVHKTEFVTVTINVQNRTGNENYRVCTNCDYNMKVNYYADENDQEYDSDYNSNSASDIYSLDVPEVPEYREASAVKVVVLPHNYVFPSDFKELKNGEIFYGDVAVLGIHGDDGMDNTPENVQNLRQKSVRDPVFAVNPVQLQAYGIINFPEISSVKPTPKSDLKIVSWGMDHSNNQYAFYRILRTNKN
jgi:hypothetical protein